MRINVSDEFKKQFKKYDTKLQNRISKAIDKLPQGDVKRIIGKKLPPLYRLRVGDYRIIYRITEEDIYIEYIDSRGDAYKRL